MPVRGHAIAIQCDDAETRRNLGSVIESEGKVNSDPALSFEGASPCGTLFLYCYSYITNVRFLLNRVMR